MKMIRNLALAAAGALALGTAALAEETNKPEAKPDASREHRGQHGVGPHQGMRPMQGMMQMRGNCHGQSGGQSGEHSHS